VKLQNLDDSDRLASIERVVKKVLPTADGPKKVSAPPEAESASFVGD
jgi:hypothetical protein